MGHLSVCSNLNCHCSNTGSQSGTGCRQLCWRWCCHGTSTFRNVIVEGRWVQIQLQCSVFDVIVKSALFSRAAVRAALQVATSLSLKSSLFFRRRICPDISHSPPPRACYFDLYRLAIDTRQGHSVVCLCIVDHYPGLSRRSFSSCFEFGCYVGNFFSCQCLTPSQASNSCFLRVGKLERSPSLFRVTSPSSIKVW